MKMSFDAASESYSRSVVLPVNLPEVAGKERSSFW